MKNATGPDFLLILVPAFNEEGAIAGVVKEVNEVLPGTPVLVIDDCSGDATAALARNSGAHVLSLPTHLGLGGCVRLQIGIRARLSICDPRAGDGQHDASDIPNILGVLKTSGCQMVIGSRYAERKEKFTSPARGVGIVLFRLILRPILGKWVSDPTSGFVGVNRKALAVFSKSFPLEYPEIETLVVLQRKAFRFEEVPCNVRPRKTGRSSITALKSVYYIVHVLLGVFVNILKYEGPRRR